jgi:acetylglutamate kinase
MDSLLDELMKVFATIAAAVVTALSAYAIKWLHTKLGIEESDSNEAEIRRAAATEAGKLVTQGVINDPQKVLEAATKIIADLTPAVKAEEYNTADIKDMILGAAATIFPPAALLKMFK